MMMLNLISLALAALAGTATGRTQHTMAVADTLFLTDTALNTDDLTKYVAVYKAMFAFWADKSPQRQSLLKRALDTDRIVISVSWNPPCFTDDFDLPKLVKSDTALAALFTRNHLTLEKYFVYKRAIAVIFQEADAYKVNGTPLPASSTVLGKNLELVKPHLAELGYKDTFDFLNPKKDTLNSRKSP